jgi:hypothetical protein
MGVVRRLDALVDDLLRLMDGLFPAEGIPPLELLGIGLQGLPDVTAKPILP